MTLYEMVLMSYTIDDLCDLNDINTQVVLRLMVDEDLLDEGELRELMLGQEEDRE